MCDGSDLPIGVLLPWSGPYEVAWYRLRGGQLSAMD